MKKQTGYLNDREWLINTRKDVLELSKIEHLNEQWKRAYENLADALDRIDAMVARSSEYETSVNEES